ncbi:shikimate kinase [bacterium]|nr:shikimate kinase [bacterium]
MPAPLILLVGPRGSGKSTVGPALAAKLGWDFADADELVEATAGRTIAGIFAAEGEAGFRDREAAAVTDLCRRTNHIIATGGGAVLREANREILKRSGFVVWLTVPPELAFDRLRADPTTAARRPNLTPAGGVEELHTLIAAREPLYRAVADFVCDTAARSPDEAASAILDAWTNSRSSSGPSPPSSSG